MKEDITKTTIAGALSKSLKDSRQGNGINNMLHEQTYLYFVCQDFRKPSKVADHLKLLKASSQILILVNNIIGGTLLGISF